MRTSRSLKVLLRARKVEEYQALRDKLIVDNVIQTRAVVLDKIQQEITAIESELEILTETPNNKGFSAGKAATGLAYQKVKREERESLEKKRISREKDLKSALARKEEVLAELELARVGMKKVEQLIEKYNLKHRIIKRAEEEISLEERRNRHSRNG